MEMQIAVIQASRDLGSIERSSETVDRPRPVPTIGQDRGRAFRNARQRVPQSVIQRNDRRPAMLALAGRDGDGVFTDMRP